MADGTGIGLGPRLLVIDTALRALIEHASSTDPTIRDRITAGVEAYLASLITEVEGHGEIEREFTERARICLAALMQPRES